MHPVPKISCFFPNCISYPVKCVPSPYRHCLTSFFRPSQLLHYYHYFYKCQKYLYGDICQYHLTDTSTKAHLEKLPLPIIFLHTTCDFLAKIFNDLFKHKKNKKKLKSCMLPWHLLHSNSLWGPVNQVPSLPGGILEMQTLQSCHFWDLHWNYRHLSQLLRARRVLCSTPSLACPPSGTNQKTRLWLKWDTQQYLWT